MLQFTKLRLNGFKSFVERTELEIAPGLNGIVGPNGCGKSNLVEALRWVMGEASAKRMRGGGMEDVIFNGTDKRSARNIAEVALLLDNRNRTAPPAYNTQEDIEIIRRIERDRGSNYKINGKNTRARDVQMLFADTVTGANSPAMVSQGRVTQIINAKPINRRMILEESAGISGLYARRHEAELRLKSADTNLLRLEDILGSMETRLNALKRQARQAARYRNVNAQIRQMEILLSYLEWKALEERIAAEKAAFGEAESHVAEHLATVTQLTKTHNTQAEDLPALRRAEAETAASLQTQKLALQRIEDEAARLTQNIAETEAQLSQCDTDATHEEQSLEESATALARIEGEQEKIIVEQSDDGDQLEAKHAAKEALENKVLELEAQYNALMQSTAEARAQEQAAQERLERNEAKLETAQARIREAEAAQTALHTREQEAGKADLAKIELETLELRLERLKQDLTEAQSALDNAAKEIEEKRDSLNAFENKKSEFDTEISLLENFLEEDSQGRSSPVLNDITPDAGFEKALSRALGDALMASLEGDAQAAWLPVKQRNLPALPSGCDPIAPHVDAPKALDTALSQIGVVEDALQGEALLERLAPGQALVSKDGGYWRWDGYALKDTAKDRHAQYLEQKNQYQALLQKRPQIDGLVRDAKADLEKALLAQEKLQRERARLQDEITICETETAAKREAWGAMREEQARYDSEAARIKDTLTLAQQDAEMLEGEIRQDRATIAAFESAEEVDKDARLDGLRESLQEARTTLSGAVRAFDLYVQEQNTRKARLQALADERVNLQNRTIRSKERIKQLAERKEALSAKLETLRNQPQNAKADQEKLLSRISELEAQRSQAVEKLAEREQEVAETAKALKEAESALSEAREKRAHAQATLGAIQEQIESMEATIAEKFEMRPADLPEHAAIDMGKDLGDLEALRGKKEQLVRERDAIGPVNLRAEEEAVELEKEVTTLLNERNDLMEAIAELRQGINTINAEARERLLGAFDHVNAHFQRLFIQLFGGGKAHLALIDDEQADAKDPLGAGLEIYAQPPGKTLQSLSLLSGGEQTLASIALIFAMFLTNPSPICVLDEIDAPLDDANVDRVCDLLEEIAERGETRFLIITHHRLTMARMDRLYGVTMAEKGVSQLVSVDLQQSFDFLEEAA